MIAGKHQIQMAGKLLYLFQKGNRLAGTICGVRIFAPRPENRTLSMASRVAGMVQILCLKLISLQRAKRSSLERMNRCSVSTTASRVNSRPC